MRIEEHLIAEMTDLKLTVQTLTAAMFRTPEWFTLRKACEFKGVEYNSVKSSKERQPRYGIPDKMDGTRKYWARKTIVEWAQIIDSADKERYRQNHKEEYQAIL